MRVRSVLLFASVTLCPVTRCPAVTVADISQHPVVRITYNNAADWAPTLSADGSRLAWAGPHDPEYYYSRKDIYVADRVNGIWQEPHTFGHVYFDDGSPSLSADGNTLLYLVRLPPYVMGGVLLGDSELVVHRYVDGAWQGRDVVTTPGMVGCSGVGDMVISGDGNMIAVLFGKDEDPYWINHCYLIRHEDDGWGQPQFLAPTGQYVAANYDGSRLCLGRHDGLDVYDLSTAPPERWVLEQSPPDLSISRLAISDDGRRVAYAWEAQTYRAECRMRLWEQREGYWHLTDFEGFPMGTLSGDGTALVLNRWGIWYGDMRRHLYMSRLIDGEWHEPIHIADMAVYLRGCPAICRDGTKIAFQGTEIGWANQNSEEIYFLEYDFPGRAVVESNIPNAPFILSGPIGLSRTTGPDCRWECDQLYVSTWTVTWGDVPHYETPPPQTQRTNVNETVHFCGEYVPSIYRLEPDEVELSVGRPVLNYATGTFFVPVEIRNVTEQTAFYARMRLVFDSFSPENTRLWNGDGLTEDGKPYIDLSDLIPNGLPPGSPALLVEVEIYNRERNPFISFEAHVTAAKAPPPDAAFTPQAADGGSASSEPRLSEEQSALRIESITLDARGVKIAWRSIAGQNYRVLHRDVLLTEWQDTAEVTATGPTTEWLDESASEESPPMRVYRIEGIPSPALKPGD